MKTNKKSATLQSKMRWCRFRAGSSYVHSPSACTPMVNKHGINLVKCPSISLSLKCGQSVYFNPCKKYGHFKYTMECIFSRAKQRVFWEHQAHSEIQRYQDTHDPLLRTIWGIPAPNTLKHLVLSYIARGPDILKDEPLIYNLIRIVNQLLDMIAHVQKMTVSTKITMEAQKDKVGKTLEELLPSYALKFQKVFKKKVVKHFPASTPQNHSIKLKKDFNVHK